MARILIIEDDDLLRGVLTSALEFAGHTVIQARNGQEGIELFHAVPVDLVLTDIVMPIKEGVETIMTLRDERKNLPIIAMSGGAANAKLYLSIAGRIGAKRILSKPFTPQHLLETVDQVLAETGEQKPDQ
jgi:DNA-binding response OmpR family regulator